MAQDANLGGAGLTEQERASALDRFHTLRPFLEEGVPLAQIARERDLSERTLRRWAKGYQQKGGMVQILGFSGNSTVRPRASARNSCGRFWSVR